MSLFKIMDDFLKSCLETIEFQADILVYFITWSICYHRIDYKWSNMGNLSICSILQYVLQYGSAILQYIAIRLLPYCFTPKVSAHWVPQLLTDSKEECRVSCSEEFLTRYKTGS